MKVRTTVVFVLTQCAGLACLLNCARRQVEVPTTASQQAVAFADVSTASGMQFRHTSGATGQKFLPETMGSGVIVFDYNNDDRPDLYFVNSCPWPGQNTGTPSTGALYRNNGQGGFDDVTHAVGLNVPTYGQGGCAGDFDNDGFPDLLITAIGGNRLFRNFDGQRFEDVSLKSGVCTQSWHSVSNPTEFAQWKQPISFPTSATWLDYDGDARLDLFVCQYVEWAPAHDLAIQAVLPGGTRAYVPPTQFSGTHCKLFRNLGEGRFADVSAQAGIEVSEPSGKNAQVVPVGKALGVVVCDPDGDGWPDLAVANDTARNFFFHNVPGKTGSRKFEEIGLPANVAYAEGRPRGGMGIDSAELSPDSQAILIANFSNEPNTLLSLRRKKPLLFEDRASANGLAALSRGPMKFGAFFFDFDLDGRLDLFTANGHLEPEIALARPQQQQAEAAQLYRNVGTTAAPRFELFPDAGDVLLPMVGRGAAYLDMNSDGKPDVVSTANGGSAKLFRNETTTGHHWLRLKLVGNGVTSNRDAIGATVEVVLDDGTTRRFFVTGSRGYLSQSELVVTVGLGTQTAVQSVTVHWPGAKSQSQTWKAPGIDQQHMLKQDAS